MTVEIAILNKSAVALAADSAVTVGNKRTFNTGDKLFMLSKVHPIGVMIYQNIHLMDVPWETIIKSYRKELADQEFGTIQEYCDHFINYLQENRLLFPQDIQTKKYSEKVSNLYIHIRDTAFEQAKKEEELSRSKGELNGTDEEIKLKITQIFEKILSQLINNFFERFQNLPVLDCFKDLTVQDFTEKHRLTLSDLIRNSFEKFEVSSENCEKLINIGVNLFLKTTSLAMGTNEYSGLVIAGFGKDQIFPAINHYVVEEIFDNRLKFTFIEKRALTHSDYADMLAFAQRNFISAFLSGIDPEMRNYVRGELPKVFKKVSERFFSESPELKSLPREKLEKQLESLWQEEVKKYYDEISRYELVQFKIPMGSFISALSKSELAAMAETFVQLTSFKVKITSELESVGGPIDVAVISKGDGFVWVKRKYYFDISYNPHFADNYMKLGEKS